MQARAYRAIGALFAIALLAAFSPIGTAEAKTFRWANDGDSNSMDPYARQETFLLLFDQSFYEPLLRWDREMKLEAGLATEWKQTDPTTWRFKLRQGVKFHDGTPFTADDVVFSFDRATHPGSNLASPLATVKEVKKIDDLTVDFITNGPDPILPNNLPTIAIMSKTWCEAHNTARAADLTKNEESFATRNANGTGPFMLKDRQPDVKTVLVKNPDWWGAKETPVDIDEADFNRVENASTRVSALLSGELDMLYTVPPQDVDRIEKTAHMKIWKTPELRTIFLGMDQSRDELLESNIKGKNPFKDKRVREAFYKAIDEEAIAAKVMRGFAKVTGLMVGPGVKGYDPLARQTLSGRHRRRQEAARRRRLSHRVRGRVRLPQRPLRQRRGGVPGGGRDAGQDRDQGQPARANPRQVFRQDQRAEIRHQLLYAGLDAGDAGCTRRDQGAGGDPQGQGRGVQHRRVLEPRTRCARRQDPSRARRRQAQPADLAGAEADARRLRVYPAAPADRGMGLARQRRAGAGRQQQLPAQICEDEIGAGSRSSRHRPTQMPLAGLVPATHAFRSGDRRDRPNRGCLSG
jgi:hypothetical protein